GRGNEKEKRADDRPIAPAKARDCKGIGKADDRADEAGQRHQTEELIGREFEAHRGKLGGGDAPDQPHRESEILGEDRPDQVLARDGATFLFPEGFAFRVPIVNPSRHASSVGSPGFRKKLATRCFRVPPRAMKSSIPRYSASVENGKCATCYGTG